MQTHGATPTIKRSLFLGLSICIFLIVSICLGESDLEDRSPENDVVGHPRLIPDLAASSTLEYYPDGPKTARPRDEWLPGKARLIAGSKMVAPSESYDLSPACIYISSVVIQFFFYFYRASHNGAGSEPDPLPVGCWTQASKPKNWEANRQWPANCSSWGPWLRSR